MLRVSIRSRIGNVVLGVLGLVYFLAASVTLAYYVISNWGANSLVDLILQGALFVAAVVSLFFIFIAVDNLRREAGSAQRSPTAREHRTTAAAES